MGFSYESVAISFKLREIYSPHRDHPKLTVILWLKMLSFVFWFLRFSMKWSSSYHLYQINVSTLSDLKKKKIHSMRSLHYTRAFRGTGQGHRQLPSPSSQAIPKKRWSLVVSAILESQMEESTNKLRAVPKVRMLLSAIEEAHRGCHQTHTSM